MGWKGRMMSSLPAPAARVTAINTALLKEDLF
jgi:hypothetical protein